MYSSKTPLFSRRFSLVAVGPSRSEDQIRDEVDLALKAALTEVKVKAVAEPEGGFLGTGLEWIWLLKLLPYAKAAGLGLAGALGKKTGDKLWDRFSDELRKRNLLAKELPGDDSTAEKRGSTRTKSKQGATKKTKKRH
jgi:hypothetical protein